MRILIFIFICFVAQSCKRNLQHERYVENLTSDTVLVLNPDFSDTVFVIPPSTTTLIYGYEILDTKQDYEVCMWQGDTLYIEKTNGLVCEKRVSAEANWTFTVKGEKERIQKCTFSLEDDDF